ncbi:tRNA (adenosine(37)-N6)-threonylcarbamoyltransferase complex dimerization subunit type 1 TsaB [Propionibacterium australiense]|uniref:Glycoprotease family n=1 Tax=Propionibacterium australiense TaxID=119981 RepID=A0A383S6I3_9ACTN|nr:tRNA (adenosine(37)-N6)-threonylcarbamoyltransferase complex dimerization subunit type 1 TsaB [Propionibacterium australiense]RLP08740.1 tRNA (adenosine(37)-N6)-threonylcarbamoyltransferase complex dimerization subunit type 1 TsaB [Propionibacterium australiense]SYZ33321.1 Glycoprotease family [Propionibacterium australiense]VEH89776.1 UGMP family protein [Propionibacterium australiense]
MSTEPTNQPVGWTLGVDTSTVVTAGLARDGRAVASEQVGDNHSHAELLVPTIQVILAGAGIGWADLAAIGVGVGPGPFTGLRVGVATAVTAGIAAGLPVKGVCSLDVIAAQWAASGSPRDVVVTSDARRKELYWATYRDGRRVGQPQVSAPAALPELPTAGPGVLAYPELLTARHPADAPLGLDAGFLAAHLHELPDAGLEPLYLRTPDAAPPSARKSALTGRRHRLRPGAAR